MGALVSRQLSKMLRSALIILCVALAVQGKTRRGPLPSKFWNKVKHLPKVDEVEDKIVGGDNVDISERPFQVVFQWYGSLICGGAWIGGNKVLTAAHCCDGSGADEVTVRAGTALHASGGTVYNVAQVKMHPEYDSGTISNDACVLVLEKDIDDSNAKPVTLPPAGITFNKGEAMTVSGWGTTSQGGSLSSHLKAVTVPYVEDEECIDNYSGDVIGEVMICAGEAGKDSCQGDSGGPMTAGEYVGIPYHVGIVSWGYGCAQAGYPGVYSQTDAFLDFINSA